MIRWTSVTAPSAIAPAWIRRRRPPSSWRSTQGASPSERLDVLVADQLIRWRRGSPKLISDYLLEHPELKSDSEALLKLIQGEFLARIEREETPDAGLYMRMFPDLAEEIRLQCEVDHWLTIPSPPGKSMATTLTHHVVAADLEVGSGDVFGPTLGIPRAGGWQPADGPRRSLAGV